MDITAKDLWQKVKKQFPISIFQSKSQSCQKTSKQKKKRKTQKKDPKSNTSGLFYRQQRKNMVYSED